VTLRDVSGALICATMACSCASRWAEAAAASAALLAHGFSDSAILGDAWLITSTKDNHMVTVNILGRLARSIAALQNSSAPGVERCC
jgi:hypothetical protein